MPKPEAKKQVRNLRRPPETVRQRALKVRQPKLSRWRWLSPVAKVFRPLGKVKNLPVWRPFGTVGRFLGKILIPPYIRNSFRELSLVTWPNWSQSVKLTGAVLIFSVIFGTIVAVADYGLDKLFKQVILR